MRTAVLLGLLFTAVATITWFSAHRTDGMNSEPGNNGRELNTYGRWNIQPEERTPERQDQLRAVERRFESTGLKIGDPFPAVGVFDEAGKPFSTKSLQGQYTVLVNGCLT